MAANLREEIRRLHKRKQIQYTNSSTERMQDTSSEGSNSGSEQGPESPARSDKALFTFKQVCISYSTHSREIVNGRVIVVYRLE